MYTWLVRMLLLDVQIYLEVVHVLSNAIDATCPVVNVNVSTSNCNQWVNGEIVEADNTKKKFYNDKIQNCKNKQKEIWSIVRAYTGKICVKENIELDLDGVTVTDSREIVNTFVTYFATITEKIWFPNLVVTDHLSAPCLE
ncbi:hypothetical protein HHI36_002126 [Cryptolaemus montrouzieri]|uniref:Uncharacterized protein n=1 Tax=Cryptolaemus montrouzieri TaxID=559131 RepID=A0ABD2P9I6_9CUCU